MSRSEFFAHAAKRWLRALDEDGTTDAINKAIDGVANDAAFVEPRRRRSLNHAQS